MFSLIENIRFNRQARNPFDTALRTRINSYFKDRGIKKTGDYRAVIKIVVMFILFIVPIALLIFGLIPNGLATFGAYFLHGIGMTGIGMCIMHDANHGALLSKPKWNKWMGKSIELIGASAEVWKIQHNVLHHTFTNVDGHDGDLDGPDILRFAPAAKWKPVHRFQKYYCWFLYGLLTLSWVTVRDFNNSRTYTELGLLKDEDRTKLLKNIMFFKVAYFIFMLVLPIAFSGIHWGYIIGAFLTMHFIAGVFISVVFQLAHLMPDLSFPEPNEDNELEKGFYEHQLSTTTNFAPKNHILSWLVGGLNFQVEHHLFPNICHVHYKKIAPIVSSTAKEYGLEYHQLKSFRQAIVLHYRWMELLGSKR